MNFYQATKKYLEDKGYKYLGNDSGLICFELETGDIRCVSEEAIAKHMMEGGYW